VYSCGEVHSPKSAPSSEHSKVAPGSLAPNSNFAAVSVVVADGPEPMFVSGAVVSGGSTAVQAWDAGSGSTLPKASTARTSKVCEPPLSSAIRWLAGTPTSAVAQPVHAWLSRRHSNSSSTAAPSSTVVLSVPVKLKVTGAELPSAGSGGFSWVWGGVSSRTFHTYCAWLWSLLPAESTARTRKACSPPPMPS
jgi:hypothetical protein